MRIHQAGSIRYYAFPELEGVGLIHAFFTRKGGISPAPWDSLNVGGTVGDLQRRVIENRVRAFKAIARNPDSIFDVWQVHSADVIRATAPRSPGEPLVQADAILTDNPAVTLFMRFADCVPVILYDPVNHVAGLVHTGWQGTAKGASRAAANALVAGFGSKPGDLIAAIGPSIGPDHYEVGSEVIDLYRQSFGPPASEFFSEHGGSVHLDLWLANRRQLEEMGVEQVLVAGECTACSLDTWYSHRGENGHTGRFGVLVALGEVQM